MPKYLTKLGADSYTILDGLDFSFVTTWVSEMVDILKTNSITIITSILVLLALVVGAFYLLGLSKKAVKSAK